MTKCTRHVDCLVHLFLHRQAINVFKSKGDFGLC